mmetsp:Transcript_20405/g.33305  ORF Transcript_20405/g.33305 Transcript_20405/m.33305 type:complete len:376 (+) Transcript_20405:63-1190(+)
MSPPCASNDNFGLTNGSNDSLSWGLSTHHRGQGSACDEEVATVETTTTTTEETTEELEQEPEIPEDATSTTPINTELSTFLSCNSANAEELADTDGIERIDLEYDYEIHTAEGADLSLSVNVFELGLLKAVADEFGLSTCEFVRRSLRKGRKLVGTSSVVGVGSYPGDTEDSIHTECEVDVDSIESSKCTPINGYMTAWVSVSDNRRLSQSDIYTAIEKYSNTYATNGEVLAVSYIGTRPDVLEANVPFIDKATKDDGYRDDLAPNSNTSSMSPGAIAGIAVASVLALLAVLAMVAKNRRGKKSAEKKEKSIIVDDNALFMIDDGDEEELKEVKDDISKASDATEDYSYDNTLPPSNTFQSEGEPCDEVGFEVKI